ncbi:MAG: DUF1428 domain-containing protein [Gammaproteobacteria bacterium]
MSYLDAMIAAVPTAKKEAYLAHARQAAELFRRHGALEVAECWGADVPDGKLTSFPLAVRKADDETVVLSWIRWPSKPARDAAWHAIEADAAMGALFAAMPFDGARLVHGGFDVVLDA